MRIPLRTKVTLTLVAFGLIPAGIVAAFAYMSAQDFMGKQTADDQASRRVHQRPRQDARPEELRAGKRQGARRRSRPSNPPPLKWELTDADREDLQRHISYTLRDHNLSNASVYLVDPMNNLVLQRSNTGDFSTNLRTSSCRPSTRPSPILRLERSAPRPIEARSEPYEPAEIVGYAPVAAPDPEKPAPPRTATPP